MKAKYQYGCIHCHNLFSTEDKWEAHKKTCPSCKERIKSPPPEEKTIEKKEPREMLVPNYSLKEFIMGANNLNRFEYPENHRRISEDKVRDLRNLMILGEHFDSPIVVNKKNGAYRIIDGNHRISAIKESINRDGTFSIKFVLIIYDNLDEDEEIQAFRKWNVGKVQSTDDFIQSIAKKVPFIRWLKSDFPVPVTIYKKSTTITVRQICNSLKAAIDNNDTGHGIQRKKYGSDLFSFIEEDFEYIKLYMQKFKDVFGLPSSKNKYYNATFFSGLLFVDYQYQEDMDITQWRSNLLGNPEILEFNKFSGREANKKMIQLIKDKLRIR